MPLKESSDELNPPVLTTGVSLARARASRTATDYLALALATCGVGYLPLAPGTWGSLVGVGVYLLWQLLRLWLPVVFDNLWTALTFALVFGITMIGIWAATRVEKISGRKDPGIVVIDEVAGQLIALSVIPFFVWSQWQLILAGFLL
ncbi:MAG: phosphatidylglycerophosphatase A, partial [Acidobacteria bacterium]|nr:phosphatidylglycerophosphatase A [Acidobacteriota bacterium]